MSMVVRVVVSLMFPSIIITVAACVVIVLEAIASPYVFPNVLMAGMSTHTEREREREFECSASNSNSTRTHAHTILLPFWPDLPPLVHRHVVDHPLLQYWAHIAVLGDKERVD